MSRSPFLLVLLLCVALPVRAHATVRNVPADYPAIQAALDSSTAGDVVLVAPGTFVGPIVFMPRHSGIRLASSAGPEVTILDGGRTGTTVTCWNVGPATSIEGFTITGGGAVPPTATIGGGLRLNQCQVTVRGNIIRDNVAASAGGIYADAGTPVIVDNVIRNNAAIYGSGGGLYFDHSSTATVQGNVIVDNSCAAFGGGVSVWESARPILSGNTIVANHAAMGGGGLYVVRSSHPQLNRTILAFNTDQGVVVADGSYDVGITFSCDDVFGNTPANFSGVADPTGVNGNLSVDPLFCGLPARDLHLADASPCAAAHSPACGRIGALDTQCSVTPVKRTTWGSLKSSYR